MAATTVSRSTEMQAVDDLLSSAAAEPAGLVMAGEPGIGKTTLWLAGVARARELGFRVLSARANQAESVLSYAMVADLLEDVEPTVLDALPDLQRVAVDRVLFRAGADAPPTDQRVTAAAIVSIVGVLAAENPVLIAIDDVQWVDVSSQAVLALAAQRLTGRVGILLAGRAEASEDDPAGWLQLGSLDAVRRVRVGPLSLGALRTMIIDRLGRAFPRPAMVRIASVSGGNPFYALELARGAQDRPVDGDSVLPSTLAELVRHRTGHFDDEVGELLLAACCVPDATVDLLGHAIGTSAARVLELLEEPRRDDVVRLDGNRVTFAHPLLARGIYTDAGPARRRRMHRALAAVEEQPELRARHLALGAATAEPATLTALDEAGASAAARGAAPAAADLYELAIGLGGDDPIRRLHAAEQHLRAGDAHRARAVLEPVVGRLGPGSTRATARFLMGAVHLAEHDYAGAVASLVAAVADATVSDSEFAPLLVRARLLLARAYDVTGHHGKARHQAELAVTEAERLEGPKLISQALALHIVLTCKHGGGRDESEVQRALRLEVSDPDVAVPLRATTADALTMAWLGRLEESLAGLVAARRRCLEIGSDGDLLYVSGHLSMVYSWLGRYSVAADVAEDMLRRGEQAGGGYPRLVARAQRALASAYLGHERAVREDVGAALAGGYEYGSSFLATWPLMVLGFLEVSLGNHAEALNALQPLLVEIDASPGSEMITTAYLPDAIEAMVAVGRTGDAIPLIERLERHGGELDRPWLLAVAARCRAMSLAAGGDLAGAEETVRAALAHHDRLPMPFERARTQLFHGQVLRRRRRKNLATAALREALTTFEELGTPLWASRAAAELTRADASRATASALTPAELRVARLTASGMANKDIASALFISAKTVEHNLSRVYRKLGVRTRAELASRADQLDGD